MAVVREKRTEGLILCNQEPKRAGNRVCSEWRCKHDESRLETAGAVHQQLLHVKFKLFRICATIQFKLNELKLFSQREKEDFLRLFSLQSKNGIFSKPAVKNIVKDDEAGRQFFKKFTVDQIFTCSKYERRMMNQKSA